MDDSINALTTTFENDITSVQTSEDLDNIRVKYLGRKGELNILFKKIPTLDESERKEFAASLNKLKARIESEIESKQSAVGGFDDPLEGVDTSIPGKKPKVGHLHPTTKVIRSINSFFRYHGYSVYEGPEIETNEYNFEKLNLPEHHPARELQDTLYISEPEVLLRTHTSSVETRAMTSEELPIRIVVPGKVYRNETSNSTNNSVFYQYEGLVVDKNVSMASLKWTLENFVKFLYGEDTETRLRCKYYPQVEPGAGMDIKCTFCDGIGCSVCKYRGWIEVLGSGMVHPNVLRSCGIDPEEWSGFAFGLGLDRLVMLKYGIDDVRKLYSGELVYSAK